MVSADVFLRKASSYLILRPSLILLWILLLSFFNLILIPQYFTFYDFPAPEKFNYHIDFWNITAAEALPLKARIEGPKPYLELDRYDVYYLSEVYGGLEVYVHGVLLKLKEDRPLPAIVLIHGACGKAENMLPYAAYLARNGYVSLSISTPGCGGKSTRFPPFSPENIVNTTGGPHGAYYYHAAWSVIRAVTFLRSLPFVDSERIGVTGASMGGILTYIVLAVDPRVKVGVSVVAAGEYDVLGRAGTLANVMAPPLYGYGHPAIMNLIRFFDVKAYAERTTKPMLIIGGTDDEFFVLQSFNNTYMALRGDKAINIAPNYGHFLEAPGWRDSALTWFNQHLKEGPPLPKVQVLSIKVEGVVYKRVVVEAESSSASRLKVAYHSNLHGERWKLDEMKSIAPSKWRAEFYPYLFSPSTLLFIIAEKDQKPLATSQIYKIQLGYEAYLLTATIITSLPLPLAWKRIPQKLLKKFGAEKTFFSLAFLSLWTGLHYGYHMPWLNLVGRAQMTIWSIFNRYIIQLKEHPLILITLIVLTLAIILKWPTASALLTSITSIGYTLTLTSIAKAQGMAMTLSHGPPFIILLCLLLLALSHLRRRVLRSLSYQPQGC